jgi:multiple sugar transport system ATP-binding protein
MASLTLRGAGKAYGAHTVIPGIDLDIRDGEFVVLVGPSGCGKSTLLRMIAGLEDISHGELLIDGRRANAVAPAKRGIAMVFQSYALYPHMTVFENMAFGLKLAGTDKATVQEAVGRAAEALQIGHLLDRLPKDLSGGQRQRVAIGRAIVRKPGVFLFDEPLSNLDASLRVQMRVELARLHRELGATMVYVTHDQSEAMTLGDRIVVLNGGRIEQAGTPRELYERPANRFVAGFLGTPKMNFIERTGADGEKVTIGIRAEHLALAEVSSADTVQDTVAHVEYLGDHVIVYTTGGLALRLAPAQAPAPGSAIAIAVPPAYCHAFSQDGRVRNIV